MGDSDDEYESGSRKRHNKFRKERDDNNDYEQQQQQQHHHHYSSNSMSSSSGYGMSSGNGSSSLGSSSSSSSKRRDHRDNDRGGGGNNNNNDYNKSNSRTSSSLKYCFLFSFSSSFILYSFLTLNYCFVAFQDQPYLEIIPNNSIITCHRQIITLDEAARHLRPHPITTRAQIATTTMAEEAAATSHRSRDPPIHQTMAMVATIDQASMRHHYHHPALSTTTIHLTRRRVANGIYLFLFWFSLVLF